jgi:environmental stress-induced protein Ves
MARLLTPNEFRSMPWKNGGGRTIEIATFPSGAALDTFLWRVSLADVERDGPFSPFPGIDRTIVLLEGAGMRLRGAARETDLTTPLEPHAFSGDAAVDCTLVAGPVRDFNAMFRRGRARGSVTVVREGEGEPGFTRLRLVYAVTGSHECVGATGAPITLEAGQALLLDEAGAGDAPWLAIRPCEPGAVALGVSVDYA